jgi:hypothetical protein
MEQVLVMVLDLEQVLEQGLEQETPIHQFH